MVSVTAVKRLEGWMTVGEAADQLGYSKQGLHRLIFESPNNPFDLERDVRGVGDKPLILLRDSAVFAVSARIRPHEEELLGRSKLIRPPKQAPAKAPVKKTTVKKAAPKAAAKAAVKAAPVKAAAKAVPAKTTRSRRPAKSGE